MDACIEWPAYKDQDGYGRISHKGRQTYAHRVAYCQHHGVDIESIKGMQVRHTCDNPPCVNPDHLILGTNAQNMLDKVERGRQAHNGGARNGQAKLNDDQVAEIRATYIYKSEEFGSRALAQKFDVSISTIQRIVNGSTWNANPIEQSTGDAAGDFAERFANPLTPYGMLVRALRIVSGTTLYDMSIHLQCSSAFLSAVEFGRKPLTDAMLADTAAYFSGLGIADTLHALNAARKAEIDRNIERAQEMLEAQAGN